MDSVLKDIIQKSASLFQQYGIRSVTMDDIARELSISKKTLYKYIKDKKDLVEKVVQNYSEKFNIEDRLEGLKVNAVEEYFEVYHCIKQMVSSSHPSMDYDLRKYYPELHKSTHENRRFHMMEGIKDNIIRGIEEGYYRDDFKIDIITRWHILRTEELIRSNFFSEQEMNIIEVLDEVFSYHLHAIATTKGIKEFKRLLKERENV
jgi:AcrR family transcriptional regulator